MGSVKASIDSTACDGTVSVGGARVALENEPTSCCEECQSTSGTVTTVVNPTVTVKARVRTGYDEDGTPTFEWTTILQAEAIVWVARKEFDTAAGFTMVKASVVVPWDGTAEVSETALVTMDDGSRWRVTGGVEKWSDRLGMELERLDGNRG